MKNFAEINISCSKTHKSSDFILINRENGFSTIGICNIGSGMKKVENIFYTSLFTENKCKINEKELLKEFDDYCNNINIFGSSSGIISSQNVEEIYIKCSGNLNLITGFKKFKKEKITDNLKKLKEYPKNIPDPEFILIINQPLSSENLLKCFKAALEAKNFVLENTGIPLYKRNLKIKSSSIIVACPFSEDSENLHHSCNSNDLNHQNIIIDDLLNSINNFVFDSLNEVFEKSDFSLGILDYINDHGLTIESMVDAGLELCVGVEVNQTLKNKLKSQILKSLEDLNVIALLMAAFQVEDSFQNYRVCEVNVDDDPAYLYTDEVLGIAISNQIAGTKATFNFKRYDEEKPGIISTLGPMVDDIIAGLIAGCMSKIFEE
ncbi:MAG: phosphatidylglycerophosphatase A [Methanobacteriaceae archaeon]|nr:phosphatidylglycerophosphatase A [Methanobacteriaceae archaeon]